MSTSNENQLAEEKRLNELMRLFTLEREVDMLLVEERKVTDNLFDIISHMNSEEDAKFYIKLYDDSEDRLKILKDMKGDIKTELKKRGAVTMKVREQ